MTMMDPWLETLGETVIGTGWMVFWLILVFGLILQWFPKTNVHFQYGAACLVLLRLCLPLGIFLSYGILPMPQSGELIEVPQVDSGIRKVAAIENFKHSRQQLIESPVGGKTLIGVGDTLELIGQPTAQNSSETGYSGMQWIGISWITGFVLSLGFWGIRTMRFVGDLRRCRPVEDEESNRMFQMLLKRLNLSQEIQLIETSSSVCSVPAVYGTFHPRVLLPLEITGNLTHQEIEKILVHELVHIKRKDHWVNCFQQIISSMYFYHPLVWIFNRIVNQIREQACDDHSVNQFPDKKESYSECLLKVCSMKLSTPNLISNTMSAAGGKNETMIRIQLIMDRDYPNPSGLKFRHGIALLLLTLTLPLLSIDTGDAYSIPPAEAFAETAELSLEPTAFEKTDPPEENQLIKDTDVFKVTAILSEYKRTFVEAETGNRNAQANLSKLASEYRAETGKWIRSGYPAQVTIEARFIRIPQVTLENLGKQSKEINNLFGKLAQSEQLIANTLLTPTQFPSVLRLLELTDDVEFLSETTLTTLSGRQAQINSFSDNTIVRGIASDDVGLEIEKEIFQTGVSIDMLPYLYQDKFSIQLHLNWQFREFLGYRDPSAHDSTLDENTPLPTIRVHRANIGAILYSGQTLVMLTDSVVDEKRNRETAEGPYRILVLCTPTIIKPTGNPLYDLSRGDLPFDPEKFSPQSRTVTIRPLQLNK